MRAADPPSAPHVGAQVGVVRPTGPARRAAKLSTKLPTSKPQVGRRESAALVRVMKTGYFGMGPETRAFEEELESYLGGGRSVLCVNSGTAALHLALASLGLGPNDEVLVPSLTYVASFQAVCMAGATPVACDVLADSGLIDLDDARRRITGRTKAIMPVHYAGNVGDIDALYSFAAHNGLRVVEDAAHAFGSARNGALIGGSGDIVCFSFDPIKNITCGQGGAVVTADPRVAERVAALRDLGIERSASPASAADFEVRGPGWRYQMSDLMACIGRVQLARFESEIKPHRLGLVAAYRARLGAVGGVGLPACEPGTVSHIFPVRLAPERRAAVRGALDEAGFETRIHYKPCHLHPAFFGGAACPVAEALYAELLTLPTHAGVGAGHVESIARILERHAGPGPGRGR